MRDMLINQKPHDWDVTTSASPGEVIDCFADVRVVATGIKHGTVTAVLNGQAVEITTYRIDGGYSDHRRPDAVKFTASLREDLARRDFTINAMAFRPDTGIVDYYGGIQDLREGIIRCVGDADKRFTEDALRILRALRFASRFGFSIEKETAAALLRHKDELRFVAQERILSELSGIDYAKIDAAYVPVLQVVVPELTALDAPAGMPQEPAIRLASLLRGLDAPTILKRLKASNALIERASILAREVDMPRPHDDADTKRMLRHIGPEALAQLFIMWDDDEGMRRLKGIVDRKEPYAVRQLAVDGKDMLAMGFAGKQVGAVLESLLTKVIDGEIPNDYDKLMKAVGIASALHGAP